MKPPTSHEYAMTSLQLEMIQCSALLSSFNAHIAPAAPGVVEEFPDTEGRNPPKLTKTHPSLEF